MCMRIYDLDLYILRKKSETMLPYKIHIKRKLYKKERSERKHILHSTILITIIERAKEMTQCRSAIV